jgi:ABC-type methionine transport system ATPase subunit
VFSTDAGNPCLLRLFMAKESKRYWLTFDAKGMRRPLICQMSRKHDLVFDIRSANVTPELGLMALELTGEPKVIEAAVKWFRRHGVQVDPI